MGRSRKPLLTRRAFLSAVLAAFLLTPAPPGAAADEAPRPPLASAEAVLAKIKAAYPEAHVLKIELERGDEAENTSWVYEIKIFPPDGRILKLIYDAQTLALLETIGGEHCDHQQQHCRRRHHHRRDRQ